MRGETESMRVWLLGGFRLSVGDRRVRDEAWNLRKAASLVKLLALSPNHRLHREQAMDALWPELGKRPASNNLRQALHAARRALASDPAVSSWYLASQDEQLALCPGGRLWVDVEAFEEAAATARRSRDPAAYRAAVELYAGELLPDDRYEEWAESKREELRQLYLTLLVELAALYEEREEHGPAVEALRKVIAGEPTREEAHVGLMRVYALSGSKGEALAHYGRLEEVLMKELGTEPAASSRALWEEIAAGRFPPSGARSPSSPPEEAPNAPPQNLPATRTRFVGREREMMEIKRALAMTRLLTLTGAGGSGKTRLALEVARDLVGAYPDGVWLVELAPLSEGALVPQAVAKALNVSEQPGRSLTEALVDALREKRLLLILDNCEHLLDSVARLADPLLDSCLHLRVLATSREPLGVAGEAIWRVPSLSMPDTDRLPTAGELTRYDAVRLFLDRARLRVPDFDLTPENGRAVAEVCGRLEGMPLAIELAAVRAGTLSVEQIADRLNDSLKLLTGGSRTVAAKQQTLRGTLDWSHELLSEPERALFGRLSAFAGSWTLEAAEAVGVGYGVKEGDVLDLLSRLVDKSLVVVRTGREGGVRYRMLEPIRQYARERLDESGEPEAVRRQHGAFFLALAQEAEPELTGAGHREWLERLEAEHDNLRAALSWSLQDEPETTLRLAVALARFWEIRSYYSEGRAWLEVALRRSDRADAAVRARALTEAGTFAWHRGDYEKAIVFHGEALAYYRELGDEHGVAFALMCLGAQEIERGDFDRALPFLEDALSISQKLGDERTRAFVLRNLGEVERHRGKYGRAIALGKEALSAQRKLGEVWTAAENMSWLGYVAAYHGDHNAAMEFIEEGLRLARELGNGYCAAQCLEGLAALSGAKAEGTRAAKLFGAAEALRGAIGAPLSPADRQDYDRSVVTARAQLDEEAWEAAWAEGKAMTTEEAVEYALSAEEPTTSVPLAPEPLSASDLANLTRREKEVASLLTRGLTNRQIASELILSERTVDNHVANILKKLELSSREQVATRLNEHFPDLR